MPRGGNPLPHHSIWRLGPRGFESISHLPIRTPFWNAFKLYLKPTLLAGRGGLFFRGFVHEPLFFCSNEIEGWGVEWSWSEEALKFDNRSMDSIAVKLAGFASPCEGGVHRLPWWASNTLNEESADRPLSALMFAAISYLNFLQYSVTSLPAMTQRVPG